MCGGLCRWPPKTFGGKIDKTNGPESTLNLKVILHGYFVQDHPPHFDKGSAV